MDAPSAEPPARRCRPATDPWHALVTLVDGPPPPAGPLGGLALGVKDIIAVAGVPRLCGAPDVVDPRPQEADAACVARLVAAGARVVATTHTHQFAYGIVTPQTANPRAPDRIAGGSSGGSAAALAAGLVDGALGTDTGGSVRIPAACCGVVGLKPTFGRVPIDGVQPLAPSLDTVGVLARDVATTARLAAALLGHPLDAGAGRQPVVGLPGDLGPLDDDVAAVWQTVARALAAAGARVRAVELPTLPRTPVANGRLLAAEAAAVHTGAFATGLRGYAPDVAERLRAGRRAEPGTLAESRAIRERFAAEAQDALGRVDVLLTPTLACRVPLVGADPVEVGGEAAPLRLAVTRLTSPWNLCGLPAGSVPAGLDGGGAPVGVQVVGPPDGEAAVLEVMALVERLAEA